MTIKYLLQDNLGQSGQYLRLTKGETRTIKCFFQNADGTPMIFGGTIAEIVAKIYTDVLSASISKSLTAGSTLTKLLSTDPAGCLGVEFSLTAANTNAMVENSSGLPMMITITDSLGAITELNFLEAFMIDIQAVTT